MNPILPDRRRFLATCIPAVLAGPRLLRAAAPGDPPFAAFDAAMEKFMNARKVPGGALAVVKNGRLVYARGYGWADRDQKLPATAESLFRIASVSKPLTAVAALRLVEAGRLKLTDRAFDWVKAEPILVPDHPLDVRLREITIAQLLHHTGGWDRGRSGDPMFKPWIIAKAADSPAPADAHAIIRYMLGQPLDFDPGARYVYSNFGYCVLGRVIEAVSGRRYEEFVNAEVLKRCGIKRMRLGRSLAVDRAPDEVHYYTIKDRLGQSVFPQVGRVPMPYGGFNLEAMDAHGGWLASVVDLARFVAALADDKRSPLLKPESIATMLAAPPVPVARKPDGKLTDSWYGCGWSVRPVGKAARANFWHNGSLPGTASILVQRHDGIGYAAIFNQRSEDAKLPDDAIDPALYAAGDAVKDWPTEDLFGRFK